MLETGIGRSLLVAIAALPGFTATGDCSASERYFGAGGDITTPFELDGGRLRVPDGPGLGVQVLPDRLAAVTVTREWVAA
jgi:O-succinylbenzoate synthase